MQFKGYVRTANVNGYLTTRRYAWSVVLDTQCTIVNTSVDVNNQQSHFMTEIRTETANLEHQLKIVSIYNYEYNGYVFYVLLI